MLICELIFSAKAFCSFKGEQVFNGRNWSVDTAFSAHLSRLGSHMARSFWSLDCFCPSFVWTLSSVCEALAVLLLAFPSRLPWSRVTIHGRLGCPFFPAVSFLSSPGLVHRKESIKREVPGRPCVLPLLPSAMVSVSGRSWETLMESGETGNFVWHQ